MAENWLTDFVKAGLVVGGLAIVIGYHDELRATGREALADVDELVRPTPQPNVPTTLVPVAAKEPITPAELAPCPSRPVFRPRVVTYVVVRQPSCGRVVRPCR